MKVLGISGSLKKNSIHTALLHQAQQYLPTEVELTIVNIQLPLYCEDDDNTVNEEYSTPQPVTLFKQQITEADALLIASPEYNRSISGPLKNALDWASRPAFNSPLKNKPVAFFSVSPGPSGGVCSLAHLRLVLASTLSDIYPGMEFSLGNVTSVIVDNQLADATTVRRYERFLNDFVEWRKKLAVTISNGE